MGLQSSVPCWVVGRMTDKLPFAREAVRLGDLISKAKIERCGERSLPVLSMTMHDGITRQSDRFKKVVASRNTSSYKVVQPGQLVVGFPIDEGVIYVQDFDEPGIMSPAYNVWNIDSAKVLPGYLNAALHSPQSMRYYRAKLRGTTARRRTITDANLLALRIPLPDINEQHQIVESLNSIQNDIGSCDSQLDIISSLIKSRFVEMFGDPIDTNSTWPRKPIKDFCELRIGPFGSSLHRRDYVEGGHALINPSHIVNGAIAPDMSLTISDERYSEMDPYHLEIGDVVLGRRGEIGRCAVVCEPGLLCGTGSMIVRPKAGCRPDYLQRVISFPTFKDALEANAVGQTMKNLNAKIVGNAVVALPPIKVQDEFASFAEHIDKLRFEQLLALKKRGSQYLIAP